MFPCLLKTTLGAEGDSEVAENRPRRWSGSSFCFFNDLSKGHKRIPSPSTFQYCIKRIRHSVTVELEQGTSRSHEAGCVKVNFVYPLGQVRAPVMSSHAKCCWEVSVDVVSTVH